MTRQRNYSEEYRRRMQRGLANGLTRSQARGHARARSKPPQKKSSKNDKNIETAIRRMNRGDSMTAASRSEHVSVERLRRILSEAQIANRKDRRWITADTRPRRLPVMTDGRVRLLIVYGYAAARLVGEHHNAAGEAVRTNDFTGLKAFKNRSVRSVNGRKHVLETDPNALHRIASMDNPPFHEIYEIVSPT